MPDPTETIPRADYDEAWKELLDLYLPHFEIRWQITRALYEHGFSADEVRSAYRLLSWMMRLPREMQLTFRRKVIEYEG